jgi:hypothetical protein
VSLPQDTCLRRYITWRGQVTKFSHDVLRRRAPRAKEEQEREQRGAKIEEDLLELFLAIIPSQETDDGRKCFKPSGVQHT